MPLYDYICGSCNEKWEEVRRMDDRKLPESLPCPKCGMEGTVQQSIVFTNISLNYVMEGAKKVKSLQTSKFQDKLKQIHENTPGSILDKSSTITSI